MFYLKECIPSLLTLAERVWMKRKRKGQRALRVRCVQEESPLAPKPLARTERQDAGLRRRERERERDRAETLNASPCVRRCPAVCWFWVMHMTCLFFWCLLSLKTTALQHQTELHTSVKINQTKSTYLNFDSSYGKMFLLQWHQKHFFFCWSLQRKCRKKNDLKMLNRMLQTVCRLIHQLPMQLFQVSRPCKCRSQSVGATFLSADGDDTRIWWMKPIQLSPFSVVIKEEFSSKCRWRVSSATSLRGELHEKMSCHFSQHSNTKVLLLLIPAIKD